jgi:protein SCO1/2
MTRWMQIAGFVLLAGCARREPLPVYSEIPPFQLTAQTGETFDRQRLDGRVWVADFIFTNCTGPCPRMSYLMSKVQQATKDMPDVKLVSFTVDPDNDTPAVLAEYAKRYRAEQGRWYFLTGDVKTLDGLAYGAFKLGNVDGSLNHSTRLVLVDRKGRVRGYYGLSDDAPVARLMEDLKRVSGDRS